MKKTILSMLALVFSIIIYAQADNKITIGTIDSVQSTILNEKRKIWVYVPNNASQAASSRPKYPVVYLLDGNRFFISTVGMIQQLNGADVLPEMIVVGILNTIRERDLTPTKHNNDAFVQQTALSLRASGGGEDFLSFIEKELMPYIDSKYPTQPYKLLVGHSFGGLTAMHTLLTRTKMFNAYVCIDPSMWWDNMKSLDAAKKALTQKNLTGTAMYMGIANTLDEGTDLKKALKDTGIFTRGIRANFELDNFIKNQKPKGLRYAGKYYPNDTHNSSPLIIEYDAFRFIFKGYKMNLENKDVLDSTVNFSEKILKRYKKISEIYGYEVTPPENEINTWGYRFIQRKQFRKAEGFFKMNAENYPQSFNVHDSYGDFYVAAGNKSKAIEEFNKALSIQENVATRNKLNKLL
jgi:predicted alpha/beta superfamily hydrolase